MQEACSFFPSGSKSLLWQAREKDTQFLNYSFLFPGSGKGPIVWVGVFDQGEGWPSTMNVLWGPGL